MRSLLIFVAIMGVLVQFSCNQVDVDGKTLILQDSLATVLPTWQALKVKVGENNTSMLIVVGDASLYKAPDAEKSKRAQELGKMVLRIFGKGNYLEKGNLVITADIHNTSETPADGVNIPIDFTALKQADK